MRIGRMNAFSFLQELLDTPDTGGASGTVTPPAAAGAVTPPATVTPPSTSPVAAAPPATSTGFTYTEDRSKWIPPHRLNEETGKRTSIEQERDTLRTQLQALVGASPKDAGTLKAEEVKSAFTQLFPHLTPLLAMSKEQIEALTKTPEAATRATQQEQRQWERHGKQIMSTVFEDVAAAMNIEKLDADQQNDLRTNFASWLRAKTSAELQASNGQESATLSRYEDSDPELLKEFTSAYTKRWVEPARRTATANVINRTRPVPSSQGRTQVTTTPRPEKFNSLDERLDYAVKVAKERGASFGG